MPSILVFSIFKSCIFMPRDFDGPLFSRSACSVAAFYTGNVYDMNTKYNLQIRRFIHKWKNLNK